MAEVPGRLQTGTSFDQAMPLFNRVFDSIDGENHTKVIRNGTTPTLLMGYQQGGFNGKDYGLKIAKDGFDVTTATDDNLAYSSGFDTLRVIGTGTASFTKPANQTSVTYSVPHSFGFAPVVLAYSVSTSLGSSSSRPWGGVDVNFTTGIVDSNSYFVAYSGTVVFTQVTPQNGNYYAFSVVNDVKYYLLQQTSV